MSTTRPRLHKASSTQTTRSFFEAASVLEDVVQNSKQSRVLKCKLYFSGPSSSSFDQRKIIYHRCVHRPAAFRWVFDNAASECNVQGEVLNNGYLDTSRLKDPEPTSRSRSTASGTRQADNENREYPYTNNTNQQSQLYQLRKFRSPTPSHSSICRGNRKGFLEGAACLDPSVTRYIP